MKNQLKTLLLLGLLSAGVVVIGQLVAPAYLTYFIGMALLMNLGAYFFSDKLVLAMHRAQEVSPAEAPRLHQMVSELSRRAGIPKPRVFLMDDPQPNAFATGRNPQHGVVAVTQGLVDILDERELRGVIAHELAHIRNRDILLVTIAAMFATVITYASHVVGFAGSALGGRGRDDEDNRGAGGLIAGLLFVLVAPLAATLLQLAVSRSREYLADETGAEIAGDPMGLARALGKLDRGSRMIPSHAASSDPATASLFIVNPLKGAGAGLLRLFSTHPSIDDRVERLVALAQRRPGA